VPDCAPPLNASTSVAGPRTRGSLARWLLASFGCLCVALGAIGVVVPGMPTTVFLLIASWAFARSCPWLEERMLGGRLGASLRKFRESGAMPLRAKFVAIASMWTGIGVSTFGIARSGGGLPSIATLIALGAVGTFVLAYRVKTLARQSVGARAE